MYDIPDKKRKNLQGLFLFIFVLVPFLSSPDSGWCQEKPGKTLEQSTKELFDSRILQLNFLSHTNRKDQDSLNLYFKEEIDYFAGQKDWETALALVDQLINYYQEQSGEAEKPVTINPEPGQLQDDWQDPLLLPRENWGWTMEVGTDYSRQEYEMSFIESDSLVLEELNKPYVAFRLNRTGEINANTYQYFQYIKSDQDLFQTSASLSLESKNYKNYWRLEGLSDFFWQYRQNSGNFWENQIIGMVNKTISQNQRMYLFSQLRYKMHFAPDSSFGQILAGEASGSYRYFWGLMSWFEIMARSSFYRENQVLGLRYGQLNSRAEIVHRTDFNRYFTLESNYYYRTFRSRQPEGDYKNLYREIQPILKFEVPLLMPFGIYGKGEWQSRRYGSPDASRSDFNFGSIGGELKFYFNDFASVGAGFVYEFENHSTKLDDDKALVEQENFTARGILVSADILKISGLLLTLSYQYTLRDFPNAGNEDLLGYYSNRRINSLMGIGYIPLSPEWQLQIFANYDNDRDRDREANDNFNTIFNIGIIYNF